ncbi:YesL family protein [Alkalihalobacillus sp. MEB130]|uniref:YesL family protein n=1 Tax=Alkalihalobacillus sp. MEB130 TaxID=2976704 RepID=UPI0028E00818|nr:YesL family protein [Alkalihalobacillus sp. MEB130]MDT8860202.1 YesL family protein [Alkalihalobacillus sp. MEB130]
MEGAMWGIYRVSNWIMKFAYVNFLWMLFTIVGLFVFGFFPATIAMFSIIRKWIMKEVDIPIFKTFWVAYKTNFVKSNVLGLIIIFIGVVLYVDLRVIAQFRDTWVYIFYYLLLIVSLLYSLTLLYVIPVYIHYEMKPIQVLKVSFLFMILNPFSTISMSAGLLAILFLIGQFPGLTPFFSGSLISFVIMFFAYYAFRKNDFKLQKNNI